MKLSALFESPEDDNYNQLVQLLKANCSKNLELINSGKAPFLYRATHQQSLPLGGDYQFVVTYPRTTPRLSATDDNYLLNFTNESPLWEGYPKRSLSNFCATTVHGAQDFGDPFLVIPFDDVTKFASMNGDFNRHTPHEIMGMKMMNILGNTLYKLHDAYTLNSKFLTDTGIQAVIKAQPLFKKDWFNDSKSLHLPEMKSLSDSIAQIFKIVKEKKLTSEMTVKGQYHRDNNNESDSARRVAMEIMEWLERWDAQLDGHHDLMKYLDTFWSPEGMDVDLATSYQSIKTTGNDREVWFQGGWIGIRNRGVGASPGYIPKTDWFKDYLISAVERHSGKPEAPKRIKVTTKAVADARKAAEKVSKVELPDATLKLSNKFHPGRY